MTALMRVLEDPRVYRLWQSPFARAKFEPVRRHCGPVNGKRVLDVGCGPGTNAEFFREADYLGLDINPKYIDQARTRFGDRFIVADVTRDRIPDEGTYDLVLVNSLLHHLETNDVKRLLAGASDQLASGGHVHILDLVMPDRRGIAMSLARWDRGAFARPLPEWHDLFITAFDPIVFEPYVLPRHGPTLWNMIYLKGQRKR